MKTTLEQRADWREAWNRTLPCSNPYLGDILFAMLDDIAELEAALLRERPEDGIHDWTWGCAIGDGQCFCGSEAKRQRIDAALGRTGK